MLYSNSRTKDGNFTMNRTFIEVPQFSRKWQELGLTDENLKALEEELLNDPKAGVAIQGTGGI